MRWLKNNRGQWSKWRIGALIVAVVVVISAATSSNDGSSNNGSSNNASSTPSSSPTSTPVSSAPAAAAKIRLVSGRSYCQERPLEARVYVFVSFRNTGTASGTVPSALPVRRYSDGSTNDSVVDAMLNLKVPAGKTRTFWNRYDYDAQAHDLLDCAIRLQDGKQVPVRVRAPG